MVSTAEDLPFEEEARHYKACYQHQRKRQGARAEALPAEHHQRRGKQYQDSMCGIAGQVFLRRWRTNSEFSMRRGARVIWIDSQLVMNAYDPPKELPIEL